MARRTGFTGSALLRLLARLDDSELRDAAPATADRWSQWLGWADAIALSAALNGNPAINRSGARGSSSTEEADCARVRSELTAAIGDNVARTTDFASYRRRYLQRQQAMEASIGPLRARLRASIAARSPELAQLAAVDVVMEQALSAREHSLLTGVPALLEKHFVRLRRADQSPPDEEAPPAAWLAIFDKDFQDVLQAELDFRFQPVEGLLETLRMRQETPREP
ncbi:DUF3348 domain-containing protein [soil metagenome]